MSGVIISCFGVAIDLEGFPLLVLGGANGFRSSGAIPNVTGGECDRELGAVPSWSGEVITVTKLTRWRRMFTEGMPIL